ncbi:MULTISPECIES: iron-containing alcohol dehydrogenase family protein [unclassified Facklamia]|uniref:iron-containing alcohol dehydrogenase family protein n=1 Tax=Aerococcaceae TaxID=186827 RepID=UPI0013BD1B66|nr:MULTISPECIES: iron-containing alcohol dehydrogenase family protein [unclassified Facklamia]NEW64493.1 iron-containing alcohol dehydrogenase [Facklamia sp. 252]NEW67700.1 iron-containing alcohol dehydrogenase [Facklamia sp. 253]QQD65680.1 iron-containing alcohol dehydrogenase family protein [Aerococcaceae bacterium zg-252]
MLTLAQVTRPGVGQYISESGALRYLDEKISMFKQPLIITGDLSYDAFLKFYPGTRAFNVLKYDRTASNENMAHLAQQAPVDTDIVIGIGGGKVLDTAKGTAELLNVEYITIPTVLGTCAAYTPLSAVYHPNHSFKTVDYYPRAAYVCLVDLDLLLDSPLKYLMGGIGDTLAKWYEAIAIAERLESWPAMVSMGLNSAKLTQEILLRDSQLAIQSLQTKQYSPEFHRVVDAIFAIAGSVGGFAGEYGRMSGAHAVHNGMSLVHETHEFEHGVKVAYGILVQLVALNQMDEVHRLLDFYHTNGFKAKLSEFNVTDNLETHARTIADFAASDAETFNLAKPDCTSDDVYQAILTLESL